MARGTQLSELVYMLRAEAGHSVLVSAGIDTLPALHTKLRRVQTMLYDDYDWPFMAYEPYIDLQDGERYYDIPTDMNLESIADVALWYNSTPHTITRGIGVPQYAQYDSDADERAGPVRNWDIKFTGDITSRDDVLEQIEVWPIPDDDGQRLQVFGKRKLRPLIAENDVCDMDDLAIVLTAAAEILASQDDPGYKAVSNAAARRISQMKGRVKGGSRTYTMGTVSPSPSMLGRPVIRVK